MAPAERVVLDAQAVERALARITYEILERNKGTDGLVFIGIRSRGVDIAERLAAKVGQIESVTVPLGVLDITPYRDDLDRRTVPPAQRAQIPFPLDEKRVVLVDDVLFTGRTVRAALDALADIARPKAIQLAILVDRGHRELPIRPDYVGANVRTERTDDVIVRLRERDRDECVLVRTAAAAS